MSEENSEYPENILNIAADLKHLGRMTAPTTGACIKGPCGEEMEFYLTIQDGIIKDVKFYTDGCIATKVCGCMTARFALGKTIDEALSISPRKIIDSLEGLPKDHCHCSILAVGTLHRAIANYLLKQ